MRENYFTKLIKYINNVYHFDKQIENISDKRVNPTYETKQIVTLVLTSFLLRVKSFNQLNCMIKAGEVNSILLNKNASLKIDAIRSSLKSINLNNLRKVNQSIIKKAIRNKVIDEGTIEGYTVAAIDGTNLFKKQSPYCDDCILKRNKGKEYYAHSCTVMSLIGNGPNLVLDYEMNKHKNKANDTGAGELISAQNLLNRAVSAHSGLIDVVVYDALVCNSPFINECIKLRVEAVVRIKKNHMLTIKKVKKDTNKKKHIKCWNDGNQEIKSYETIFYMYGVDQPLRYVKFAKKYRNGD